MTIDKVKRGHDGPLYKRVIMQMGITSFVLLLGLVTGFAHVGKAQRITLEKEKGSFEEIINAIRQQTGYNFMLDKKIYRTAKPVNIRMRDASLPEVMDAVMAGQDFTYKILDDIETVVIKEKEKTITDRITDFFADGGKAGNELKQDVLRGRVLGEDSQPLPGATVRIAKTNITTFTDRDGRFTLRNVPEGASLVISYVGYESKEIAASKNLDGIQLVAVTSELSEVMVNKGYYSVEQKFNTGSVSIVKGEDIQKQPVSDPILALIGRVNGLQITQTSGAPGSKSTIRLRGQNSIANGNDPLFIVDGVPFNSQSLTDASIGGGILGSPANGEQYGMSPFGILNPGDIDNIQILKDADATSIYGSRGANGVILITTKKGKTGDTKVSLDISQGFGKVTQTMSLLNTQQYLEIRHEALTNDGLVPDPDMDFDLLNWDTTRYTNWQKVLLGNTVNYTNANISISGGDAHTQFLVGSGFNRQTTLFPGDYSDKKAAMHFTLNHSSNNQRFLLQLTGSYSYNKSVLPQMGTSDLLGYVFQAPNAPAIYNTDGSFNWELINGTASWNNPLAKTNNSASAITNSLTSNFLLSYKILPGLELKSSFGFTNSRQDQSNKSYSTSVAPPDDADPYVRSNYYATSEFKSWIIEPQLNYNTDIGKGRFNLILGSTIQENLQNFNANIATGFASDALVPNPLNGFDKTIAGFDNILYHYFALFGRLSYNWDDKYLINLTARRDGSSRFGPSKQFGNFGAIGLGWIFSQEKFIKENLPWLTFGKLRGSYGISGSDQITPYQYLSSYSSSPTTYQQITGLFPTRIANPYFGWEANRKLEGGLELGALNDRINFSFSYYNNRSDNQLVNYPLPNLTGFPSIQRNLPAVVQNTGTEFSFNSDVVKGKNFTWSTSLGLTIPRNKLISFPDLSLSSYANLYVVGKPLSINRKFQYLDVNSMTGVYEFASADGPTNNPKAPADYIVADLSQKFYGGIQNSFGYKNFQLDVFFQFVNQKGLSYFGSGYTAGYINYNLPSLILDHWQKTGDHSDYGRLSTQFAADPNNKIGSSNFGLSDASFVRLKNIAFSYQLPIQWQKPLHLTNARVYLHAQNLLTFDNYLGFDPETGAQGLPPLRMINVGINTTF